MISTVVAMKTLPDLRNLQVNVTLFLFLLYICYLLIFGHAGSSFQHAGFLWLQLSRGYSPVGVNRLLIVAASLLQSMGSVLVVHGLSGPVTVGVFPDQGFNPCPLHWQADSSPLDHQRSPFYFLSFSREYVIDGELVSSSHKSHVFSLCMVKKQ